MLYTGRVEIQGGVLNVRSAPGGLVTGTLEKGSEVQVLADGGAWVEIAYSGGSGYAAKQYIVFVKAAADARLVVTDEQGHAFPIEGEATIRIAAGAID